MVSLLQKDFPQGPVTTLQFSDDGSLLFVAIGSALHIYEVATAKLQLEKTLIDGRAIHGVAFASSAEKTVMGVFGQKKLQLRDQVPRSADCLQTPNKSSFLRLVCDFKELSDMIWDVCLMLDDDGHGTAVIGFAHNFVQLWKWSTSTDSECGNAFLVQHVQCKEQCLLYCMSFWQKSTMPDDLNQLKVASGTVFNQILLWCPFDSAKSDDHASKEKEPMADVVQRLCGHGGVLFRICWSPNSSMIASVSDDRTVRLWRKEEEKDSSSLVAYTQVGVGWGHKARLWDVEFIQLPQSHSRLQQTEENVHWGLITASEDTTAKVWDTSATSGVEQDVPTLVCKCTLRGHAGRHIWRIAAHPYLPLVATGGNDSSTKLWHWPSHCEPEEVVPKSHTTSGHLPASDSHDGSMRSAFAIRQLRSALPSSLSSGVVATLGKNPGESVRCLQIITRGDSKRTLFIATSKGILWSVELQLDGSQSKLSWKLLYDPNVQAATIEKCDKAVPQANSGQSLEDASLLLFGVNTDDSSASGGNEAPSNTYQLLSKRQRKKQKCRSERNNSGAASSRTICCMELLPSEWVHTFDMTHPVQGVLLGSAAGEITLLYLNESTTMQTLDDSRCEPSPGGDTLPPKKTPRRNEKQQSARDIISSDPGSNEYSTDDTCWKAHMTRVANLFTVRAPNIGQNGVMDIELDKSNHLDNNQMLLFSASADGELKCWRLPRLPAGAFKGKEERDPELVACFRIPRKSCVTSMCVKWCETEIDDSAADVRGLVYCGDGRGNLFVFSMDRSSMSSDYSEPTSPVMALSMPNLHGRDIITVMQWHGDYLYTAGHDGYVNQLRHDRGVGPLNQQYADPKEEEFVRRHGPLVCIASQSTSPIASVEQLHWHPSGDHLSGRETLVAVGYYGNDLIIKDVTNSQELLRTSAGGWKRPHAVLVHREGVSCRFMLASAPPTNKRTPVTELVVRKGPVATLALPNVPNKMAPRRGTEIEKARWRRGSSVSSSSIHARTFGTAFHGRVATSAFWCRFDGLYNMAAAMRPFGRSSPWTSHLPATVELNETSEEVHPQSLLITSGQDNVVKVFQLSPGDPNSVVCASSREGHPTVIRDLTVSHLRPPKALCSPTFQVPPLVVSVGGKEIVVCWQLVGQQNQRLLTPTLELVCSHSRPDALMDHRHTAVTAFPFLASYTSGVPEGSGQPHEEEILLGDVKAELETGRPGLGADVSNQHGPSPAHESFSHSGTSDRAVAAAACSAHAADPVHLLGLGTSEGRLLLLAVKQKERQCSTVAEFWYNETRERSKPVMCVGHHLHTRKSFTDGCSGRPVFVQTQLLMAGSTDGTVAIFDVGPVSRQFFARPKSMRRFRHKHAHHHDKHHQHDPGMKGTPDDPNPSDVVVLPALLRYSAHAMGTNCLSVSSSTLLPTKSTVGNGKHAAAVRIVIVTGGDDESITVARFALHVPTFNLRCISLQRVLGASGSALKSIGLMEPPGHRSLPNVLGIVVSSGYEQRFSVWALHANEDKDEEPLQGRGMLLPTIIKRGTTSTPPISLLAETFVEVADVGGIGLTKEGDIYSAAVVGEGMHVVHMDVSRNK